MWCWFYLPDRLPPSYNRWITALAQMDVRILELLRRARSGRYVYGRPAADWETRELAVGVAREMGLDEKAALPEYVRSLSWFPEWGKRYLQC
jgi:hypothetical protein